MRSNRPATEDDWNWKARGETDTQRLDRQWNGLLQELRVLQTGVQLLTGFLLILPFQPRFDQLTSGIQYLYLATVSASMVATVFILAPVSNHRVLFRQRKLRHLVESAHRFAIIGLFFLGLALVGSVVLIFDAVLGPVSAVIGAVIAVVLFAYVWLVAPWSHRADPATFAKIDQPTAAASRST
ncbi:DUF6328 family protein [Antrihabitans sp. YC2-6]|uniref:DUF6328 family protein n=1 Tax=Antrihabitans sp. YC2-6 TaxID=2799498 RepID=UPI001F3943D9|nr:DUF6328 family protein [Antrihabitans sp. YC2-6]